MRPPTPPPRGGAPPCPPKCAAAAQPASRRSPPPDALVCCAAAGNPPRRASLREDTTRAAPPPSHHPPVFPCIPQFSRLSSWHGSVFRHIRMCQRARGRRAGARHRWEGIAAAMASWPHGMRDGRKSTCSPLRRLPSSFVSVLPASNTARSHALRACPQPAKLLLLPAAAAGPRGPARAVSVYQAGLAASVVIPKMQCRLHAHGAAWLPCLHLRVCLPGSCPDSF